MLPLVARFWQLMHISFLQLKVSTDFASIYNAMEELFEQPYWRLGFDKMLDLFNGIDGVIEQSIVGDLGAVYKKISPFAKWIHKNANPYYYDEVNDRYQKRIVDWSSYE